MADNNNNNNVVNITIVVHGDFVIGNNNALTINVNPGRGRGAPPPPRPPPVPPAGRGRGRGRGRGAVPPDVPAPGQRDPVVVNNERGIVVLGDAHDLVLRGRVINAYHGEGRKSIMEVEYGVKTTNKFLISEFTGVDDDDVLDPSEILQKLLTNQLKNDKSALKKKQQLTSAAAQQQKKKVPVVATGVADNDKTFDKTRQPIRNADEENDGSAPRDFNGPRRFPPRGGMNQGRGFAGPRTRLPKSDRTTLPPRMRPVNENDQSGFAQEKSFEENGAAEAPRMGPGFGGGFNAPDDSDKDGNRQFGGRPRGFGNRRYNNRGGGFGGQGDQQANNQAAAGNGYRQPRRQFDRQSGSNKTGVKSVDKRDGSGAHNWGSDADAVAGSMEGAQTEQQQVQPKINAENDMEASPDAGVEGEQQEKGEEKTQQPEEPVQFTFEEWKARQGPKNQPQFNVRRAGEGDKNPTWDKLKPLKKPDEQTKKKKEQDHADEDDEEEYEEDSKIVPIDIRFIGEPVRRGGARGGMRGRGGARGGFGIQRDFGGPNRNAEKEKSSAVTPYKIDDESFPSLG